MAEQINKNDPRAIRTRQLIIDAFNSIHREKNFKNITIGDIAKRAQINRGTFYSHFADIYDIMECVIIDWFMNTVYKQLQDEEELTIETLRSLIIAVCNYHEQLGTDCRRTANGIIPLIEIKVKDKLEEMISGWISKHMEEGEMGKSIQWIAVMVSNSIYSAAYTWNCKGRKTSVEVFADEILNFLSPGLQAVMGKES